MDENIPGYIDVSKEYLDYIKENQGMLDDQSQGILKSALDIINLTRAKIEVRKTSLKFDNNYKCGHCGFEGSCYGVPHSEGVSAPFCTRCGKNDKLKKMG
jgi:hypothetical protein